MFKWLYISCHLDENMPYKQNQTHVFFRFETRKQMLKLQHPWEPENLVNRYTDIARVAPLAQAAEERGLHWLALLVSIGALGNTLTTDTWWQFLLGGGMDGWLVLLLYQGNPSCPPQSYPPQE